MKAVAMLAFKADSKRLYCLLCTYDRYAQGGFDQKAICGEHGIGSVSNCRGFVDGCTRIVYPTVEGAEVRTDTSNDGGLEMVQASQEFGEREGGGSVEPLEFKAGWAKGSRFDERANLFSSVARPVDDGLAVACFPDGEVLKGKSLAATCCQGAEDGVEVVPKGAPVTRRATGS